MDELLEGIDDVLADWLRDGIVAADEAAVEDGVQMDAASEMAVLSPPRWY